jgi:hypothetical protein
LIEFAPPRQLKRSKSSFGDKMRIALIILLIASSSICGLAKSPKRETIVGTVIAYDQLNNLIQITFAPSRVAFIVRTRPSRHKPSQLVEVLYTYWSSEKRNNGGFPNELVASSRQWRFKLVSHTGCEPLEESVPFTDVKTGKDTGERVPIWKLLPGADSEKLPFGETLPCYSLKAHDYKPIAR